MKKWNLTSTPELVLDINQLSKNMKRMTESAKANGVRLRPHVKTHKSIEVAKKQLEEGADGLTVATLKEAEVFKRGGFRDILMAYPLRNREKISQFVALADGIRLIATVDELEQASRLNEEANRQGQTIEVWVKINSGLNRCGVEPEEEAVNLVREITTMSSLDVTGLFTHAGHAYGAPSDKRRVEIANEEAQAVLLSAHACEQAGYPIEHRSVGSTPTYEISGRFEGITEVRPGNAVFFDGVQAGLGVCELEECAVTVVASVVSIKKDRVIVDAGSKALTLEKGAHGNDSVKGFGMIVEPTEHHGLTLTRLSEEHGIMDGTAQFPTDYVRIVPNHVCTAVNLYDHYVVVDGDTIVDKWSIDAKGFNTDSRS
ncbi:alanine racemase [Alteribacter aurantiacus]|uniref:alanine racemase n=1 Tax=Alteribacter aurantiacus TaxID=254410 RepID=UPI000400FE2B|nr:alanine racemase [Alteribacter aurantiacus]